MDEDFKRRLENYDEWNDAAHAALLAGVSEELQEIVSSCVLKPESARVSMRLFKEKYDHETTTSTLELFNSFLELKMEDHEAITNHISRFETSFSRLQSRCSESSRPEAIALHNFPSVEEVKVMCLFRSFTPPMYNIVDNLSTKDNLSYSMIQRRLLDRQSIRSNDKNPSAKAYFAGKQPTSEKGKKANTQKELECTWCKKYGKKYRGHVFSNCSRLREYKQQKFNQDGKPYHDKNKAHIAFDPSARSADSISISDIEDDKAFLSSAPSCLNHWVLDSGCSAHMTSRKDLLTSL